MWKKMTNGEDDHQLTLWKIAELNMNRETVRLILTKDHNVKKFVPKWN